MATTIQPIERPPTTDIVFANDRVRLKIGEKIIDYGMLYLTNGSLSFQPNTIANGLSIAWNSISVFGEENLPAGGKSIFFIFDHKLCWPGVYEGEGRRVPEQPHGQNGNAVELMEQGGVDAEREPANIAANEEDEGNVTDEGDDDVNITECWLIPDDANVVPLINEAMRNCQINNPDPSDSVSEESDFMDDDDYENHGHLGGNNAENEMQNLNLNDDRFADADE